MVTTAVARNVRKRVQFWTEVIAKLEVTGNLENLEDVPGIVVDVLRGTVDVPKA